MVVARRERGRREARPTGSAVGRGHPLEMRLAVGKRLRAGVAHGEQKRLARAIGCRTRTLRNWRETAVREERGSYRPPGRPRTPDDACKACSSAWAIASEKVRCMTRSAAACRWA